jgi:hypothetical protein
MSKGILKHFNESLMIIVDSHKEIRIYMGLTFCKGLSRELGGLIFSYTMSSAQL